MKLEKSPLLSKVHFIIIYSNAGAYPGGHIPGVGGGWGQ